MTGTGEDGSFVRPAATKPSVDPILDAKLHRPPTRADWVERDRLLELLDRAVERPVILVAAPAGFGKTTLVDAVAGQQPRTTRRRLGLTRLRATTTRCVSGPMSRIALERAGCRADRTTSPRSWQPTAAR